MSEDRKNAARFMGFAGAYDNARPAMPDYPVQVIRRYLGHEPGVVVDLGCGTGLSTQAWAGQCARAIGVDASPDMLKKAEAKQLEGVTFRHGYGSDTGLEAASADAVVCVMSFHWMEPESTLKEIGRILKPGGVFATVDYDWPPMAPDWRAEEAFMRLYDKVKLAEKQFEDVKQSFVWYPKEKHLANMQASGLFRYCREMVFAHRESCTAQRYIALLFSQSRVQAVLKRHPDFIADEVEHYVTTLQELFGDKTFDIDFAYRMRLGIREDRV